MTKEARQRVSLKSNIWVEKESNTEIIKAIQLKYGVPEIVARVLVNRNIGCEEARSFFSPTLSNDLPDPSTIPDIDKAAKRIAGAIEDKKKIAVFGDYDVDGATSSAIMDLFLRSVGATAIVKIPDREDGYGPEPQDVDDFISQGADLFLTVDCGITSLETADYARKKELDMIVVDHHEPGAVLPDVLAIVNPKLKEKGKDNPCRMMAAVGVVFMLVVAVSRELRGRGYYGKGIQEPDLKQWLDLVAFGTVCDVVPLVGINRLFVKTGMFYTAKRSNLGMTVLAEAAGVEGAINNYHLGFVLGPRVNAGGRIGSADLGYNLLVSENREQALEIASELNELNIRRREIEQDVLLQSIEQIESAPQGNILFVKGNNWHQGVVGIVAGRLKDRYGMPALVVTVDGDKAKGSARSINGFDLGAVIIGAVANGLLLQGGGHMMAAGFSLMTDKLDDFKKLLEEKYLESEASKSGYNCLEIDNYISLSGVNTGLLKELEKIQPYGEGNSEPIFAINNVSLSNVFLLNNGHIKCSLRGNDGSYLNAIAFRAADSEIGQFLMQNKGEAFDVAGKVSINRYRDREIPQMVILDIRP